MLEPEREELLSAYLDGEVSPAERARVEQWLAESAELRQLRDELLSLRAELKALPRHKLEQNLAASVLTREQSGKADQQSDEAGPGLSMRDLSTRVSEWWSNGSAAHRFFWPAVAVAAALAILIFDANQRTQERQVAQAPEVAAQSELAEPMEPGSPARTLAAPEPSSDNLADAEAPAASVADRSASQRQNYYVDPSQTPPAGTFRDAGRISAAPGADEDTPEMARGSRNATPQQVQADGAIRLESNPALAAKRSPPPLGKHMRQVEGGNYALPPAGPRSAGPQAFVCTVTPQYLQENRFDELLLTNKINFQRVPVTAEDASKTVQLYSAEAAVEGAQQSLYLIEAAGSQVKQIIDQVPQTELKASFRQPLSRMTLPPDESAGQAGPPVQVLLIAPTADQRPEPAAAPKPAAK